MESDESAGGAADSCPAARPRLRCGTLLLGSALMQSAHLAPSLAAGRRPFSNRPFGNRPFTTASLDCGGGIRRGRTHALRPFQRASRHTQARPRRIPRAMARDVRNQPAIATRFLS